MADDCIIVEAGDGNGDGTAVVMANVGKCVEASDGP